jgi:cytoskeletal protein RodZ
MAGNVATHRIELLPRDLIEWRKAKGISLPQIAETTKISLRYLEAIERGAFDKLPGGVYTANYIHQYARAVDDANNALWDYYRNVFVPKEVPPVFPPEPESRMCRLRKRARSFLGLAPKPSILPH